MLRRKSSRSTHRRPLGRSKSTSSISRRRNDCVVNIHPALAERDAHIAANLSYYHGQHRHHAVGACSCEGSHCSLLRRSNSVNGRLEGPPNGIPKRKQSVRFTGPNAKPRRQLAARAKPVVLSKRSKAATDGTEGLDNSHLVSDNSNYERSSAVSYTSRNSNYSIIRSGGQYDVESVTLKPVQPFLGSLRKSKSMYSQSAISVPAYDIGPTRSDSLKPLPTTPSIVNNQSQLNDRVQSSIRRSLRAPKSMSYLDFQGSTSLSGGRDNKRNDCLTPDKGIYPKGSFRRLKSHSSVFFRSKHRRHDSSVGLSRSLRNSSDNSAALSSAFSGNTIPGAKHTGIRSTARKVSKTVRNKLGRLFGRSKSTDTGGIETGPNRPLETDSDSFRHLADSSPIGEASMCRVASHVPSLHAVPSYQQMRSRQGSFENIPHEENIYEEDKSRITSWTNSTANTVIDYTASDEREYQRLSVIKEHGMHIPSSSHIAAHNDWITPTADSATSGMAITSQRVYSALMKKLNSTAEAVEDAQNYESTNHLPEESVPPRQSSLDQLDLLPWSPPTIRCIGTDDDDVFEDTKETASLKMSETGLHNVDDTPCGNMSRKLSYKAYPNPSAGDGKGMSPNNTPLPSSSSKQQCIRADRNSTFSPSLDNHFFRTTSPYRRALQQSMKEHQESEHTHALDTRYLSTLSALSLPTRRASTVGSERDTRLTYAESFYSFTTDELTTTRPDGIKSPPIPESQNDVVADLPVPVEPPADVTTPVHGRDISAASSVEWKTWLSAHVSKLETPRTEMDSQYPEQPTDVVMSTGHIRENAEIESPGETPMTVATSAGGGFPGDVASPHSIGTRTSSTKGTGSPLKSADKADGKGCINTNRSPSCVSPAPPPVPCRNVLRSVPSLPKVDGDTAPKLVKLPPGLLRMRSLNTLPSSAPQSQDGTPWKRCDQENSRTGALTASKSTPGLAAAIQRDPSGKQNSPGKFGTGASTSPRTPEGIAPVSNGLSESTKSEWDAQIRGSRRMVDLFLSSRRKAIQGTMSRNGSENFSTAFL